MDRVGFGKGFFYRLVSHTMDLYDDITNKEGKVVAFQVEHIGRHTLCSLLVKLSPGVRIIRLPCFLSWFRELDFCEFELEGITFVAKERPGLSSWIWVGTKPACWCPQIDVVRAAFQQYNYDPVDCGGPG